MEDLQPKVIHNLPRLKVGALREQEMVPGSKRAGALQKNPGWIFLEWNSPLGKTKKLQKAVGKVFLLEDGVGKS